MKTPAWVLRETVLALHEQLLAEFGGAAGVRDEGLLDSALGKPENLIAYGKPTLFDLAASYGFGLVKNHPFIDGNGRAARLLMNLALLQAGYPVTIIPPILRRDYLDTLNKTHKGDNMPFIKLIIGVCYESSKEYLRLLEG